MFRNTCGLDLQLNQAHPFPDAASTADDIKSNEDAETDLLARLTSERAGDGRISFEIYNPNCPTGCVAGADTRLLGALLEPGSPRPDRPAEARRQVRRRRRHDLRDGNRRDRRDGPVQGALPERQGIGPHARHGANPSADRLRVLRAAAPPGSSRARPAATQATSSGRRRRHSHRRAIAEARFALKAADVAGTSELTATGTASTADVGNDVATIVTAAITGVTAGLSRGDDSTRRGRHRPARHLRPAARRDHPSDLVADHAAADHAAADHAAADLAAADLAAADQPAADLADVPITQFGRRRRFARAPRRRDARHAADDDRRRLAGDPRAAPHWRRRRRRA